MLSSRIDFRGLLVKMPMSVRYCTKDFTAVMKALSVPAARFLRWISSAIHRSTGSRRIAARVSMPQTWNSAEICRMVFLIWDIVRPSAIILVRNCSIRSSSGVCLICALSNSSRVMTPDLIRSISFSCWARIFSATLRLAVLVETRRIFPVSSVNCAVQVSDWMLTLPVSDNLPVRFLPLAVHVTMFFETVALLGIGIVFQV